MGRQESPQLTERKTQVDTDAKETSSASKYYLISEIFLLTYIIIFEPETPADHVKYQKTRIVA